MVPPTRQAKMYLRKAYTDMKEMMSQIDGLVEKNAHKMHEAILMLVA